MGARLYKFATEDGEVAEVGLEEVLEALDSVGLRLPESTTETDLYHNIVVGAAVLKAIREEAAKAGPAEPVSAVLMSTLRTRYDTIEKATDAEVAETLARNSGLPLRWTKHRR